MMKPSRLFITKNYEINSDSFEQSEHFGLAKLFV